MINSLKIRDGFSVMETLVAMALLSLAIIPLYAFQQTLANTAARLQTTAQVLDVEQSALAILQTIDPVTEPEGDMPLGEWRLRWTSEVLASESPANGYLGSSIYEVRLVEINATLERGNTVRPLQLRQVGWVQVVDPLRL